MANIETAPEAKTDEKPATVRVSGNVPADLYERLYENDRFDKRKDKGDYLAFILGEYAKTLKV